jgi:hypothetical protein
MASVNESETPLAAPATPNGARRAKPENVETSAATDRGAALPGDRGPRSRSTQSVPEPRPSFWRRISLGRKHQEVETLPEVLPAASATTPAAANVEQRIVEPMLQALVSVEAKLERSHVELMGRSDQVEHRLTQLWDIEEQLGALGELQESLLQVSEQQRRLESAIHSQTRSMRWLVGTIVVTLMAAAFVLAAVIR